MIRQRVRAGLKTVKAAIARDGKFTSKARVVRRRLGRPRVEPEMIDRARIRLARGIGNAKTARPPALDRHGSPPHTRDGRGFVIDCVLQRRYRDRADWSLQR